MVHCAKCTSQRTDPVVQSLHRSPSQAGHTGDEPVRTIQLLALAAFASATVMGSAIADERINFTPPLYREQARATAAVRPASELTTTPNLTAAAPATRQAVADAGTTR